MKDKKDNDYYEVIIKAAYDELRAWLEVDVRGASMLINNETMIKEKMLQLISIGYNKRMNEQKANFQRKLGKCVLQIGLDGIVKERHTDGIRSAERKLGLSNGAISHAVKHGNKSAGFYWIKEEDYNEKDKNN